MGPEIFDNVLEHGLVFPLIVSYLVGLGAALLMGLILGKILHIKSDSTNTFWPTLASAIFGLTAGFTFLWYTIL